MSNNLIIAIDGPAGSGKSTTAKLLAQKLGYLYIDTGAMYRAITYLALRHSIIGDPDKIIKLAEQSEIELDFIEGETKISVNGEDLTGMIRTLEVNKNVSDVSKIKGLRKLLVRKQREMGKQDFGVVMEGRDITTVVFPDADVKIYLTAYINERARRRAKEFLDNGTTVSVNEIKRNLEQRDIIDSNRQTSPLKKADDAIEVDTSNVSIDEQVNIILNEVKKAADKKGIKLNIKT